MKNTSTFYPVSFIYGPEDYLIQEEIRKLLSQTLSPKEKGLNFHHFSGEEHSGQEIVGAAQTLPMFSRYRFVLVGEADGIDEEKMEILLKYIQDPSPSTCLVMVAQTLGAWKRHRKEIERVGRVIECIRLKGKALVSWMRNQMKERGKILSEDAADYLIEVTGDHLHDLENVLEKASLSVGEKRTVELSDVEGIASEVKVSTVFDLTDAIGNQDLERALSILEDAMVSKAISFKKEEERSRTGDPIPLLLSMMARQYRLIWRVRGMVSGQYGLDEVAKRLNLSQWVVRNLIHQGKNFTDSSLRESILKCHQTDLAIKRGRGPKELLMEKLVIDLCTSNRLAKRSSARQKGPGP